ncbi:MAG TPA: phosphatase PAP2 family protein, partial [Pirellulales bacterium]|nr:phosphatase PAP2 family protein [Pirellulales bacterium]
METTRRSKNRRRALWLLPPLAMLALACLALTADLPVARWAAGRDYPRAVRELMSIAEALGHGVGVTLVVVTVFVLDPAARRRLPRFVAAVALGGLGANVVKLIVARDRPGAVDLPHTEVAQTFGDWLPLAHNGSLHQSFPSAHTATAVAMAWMLAVLYPRGRWWFGTLAVLVAAQRVLGGAHFVSDVLAGAAVGWFLAVAASLNAQRAAAGDTLRLAPNSPRPPADRSPVQSAVEND